MINHHNKKDESSSIIIHSGFLQQKEGSLFNRWKKYWFVLTKDGKLFKFKKQTEKFTLNWNDISHQPIQEYILSPSEENQKCEIQSAKNICGKNCSMALTLFNNKTNNSTLLMLIAENQLEYEEWFNVFRKMIHSENSNSNSETINQVDKEYEQMNALLNAILDAAVISDTVGTILAVNEAMTSVFGYTREEMIGQNVKILMPSHLARIHDEYLQRYLKRRDKRLIGKSRNVLGKKSNGVTFPVEISLGEMSNSSMESMKPAYIAVFRSKTFESTLEEEKEPTMHKSWTVAAFQDEDDRSTDSESSQSNSSCSNIADDHTYLDYDDPDVPYQHHVQHDSWLNHRTSLNLQFGHLMTNPQQQQQQNWYTENHSPLSSSPSSNTSSTSSVTSNEDVSDPFHSASMASSNMILKNLQFSDFSNYELQQNLTRIRLNKKRMKQQGDNLKTMMDEILNSEFSALRVKLMLMKHQVQVLEEENQILQKQMDSQHESLLMKELELGILENGTSSDIYFWKKLIRDKNIFEELKRIAKEERQLSLVQYLSRSIKYEDTFSTHKEEQKSVQRFMKNEAESICEKFFGIKPVITDQEEKSGTTLDPQHPMIHSQSMSTIDESDNGNHNSKSHSRKQCTVPIARIMLSSKCEDILKSHLLFPTPQMFDMPNKEVTERLKKKTFQQYLISTKQDQIHEHMDDLIDTIL